ncbi:hypothetical protein HanPSC8_Chr03g0112151 [Helianthus annuus]|nr:hypothetical protein HanPSC8_Chr03g0112151 [Helianthus annuus]
MHKLDSEGFVMRNPQKMSNEKKKRKKRNGSLKKIKASSFPSNGHNTWHLGLIKASSFPSNGHNTWLGLHLGLVTYIRITYVIKLHCLLYSKCYILIY